jgi:hypothetical protein
VHQNQMERDIYNQCQNKLRRWARDSQQLHDICDVPVELASRNIMWLLLSLATWIAYNTKIDEDVMVEVLVTMMREHKEKDHERRESDWHQP